MHKILIEKCLPCNKIISNSPIHEDGPEDDSNIWAEIRDYKLFQLGKRPFVCFECGSKLVAKMA